tara:strand:+ start:1211 stop:1465 length:255 start_codon:yes stop_codon:yes gene_type:complete
MKTYLMEVNNAGERTVLKTFANSVAFAIDNMVLLGTVEDIFSIEDVETKRVWDFNGDFNQLKDMRKGLPFDVEKMVEGEEIKLQ